MYYNENTFARVVKIATRSVIGILVIILILSSAYILNPGQQAVVTTLGSAKLETTTGMKFKLPFIQRKTVVDVSVSGFPIGYREGADDPAVSVESLMITKDLSFVNVDFYVEYEVSDAIQYLYGSDEPEKILFALAQSTIRDTIGLWNIDDVITTGKAAIQAEIQEKLTALVAEAEIGLRLVSIRMQDAYPPTAEVEAAFKQVEDARQQAERLVYGAQQYNNENKPKAEGTADEILRAAEAVEESRANEAIQQIVMFNEQFEEFQKHPELVKSRLYWETMERVMNGKDVTIVADETGALKMLDIGQEVRNNAE